jgi:hypothetical protein
MLSPRHTGVPIESSCKRLFCFSAPTAHVSGSTRQAWGKASTVGRYETEAGVAKLVPLYRATGGLCVAPYSNVYEGLSLLLGRARLSFTTSR